MLQFPHPSRLWRLVRRGGLNCDRRAAVNIHIPRSAGLASAWDRGQGGTVHVAILRDYTRRDGCGARLRCSSEACFDLADTACLGCGSGAAGEPACHGAEAAERAQADGEAAHCIGEPAAALLQQRREAPHVAQVLRHSGACGGQRPPQAGACHPRSLQAPHLSELKRMLTVQHCGGKPAGGL